MLQKLYISNYAIIDELEIVFTDHLNIITGETGAGKSILLGALGLILGDRADTGILRDKNLKCIVEATFLFEGSTLVGFFEENDLDYSAEILVRREISAAGKSRAFINDTPATLTQLRQLSARLVDLHQQFDTLELGTDDFQREVLDALAGNTKLLQDYQQYYRKYRSAAAKAEELKQAQAEANRELDYNKYLWNELEEAAFRENEIEEIDEELKVMTHAENIKTVLSEAYYQLEENDPGIVLQLKQIEHKLSGLAPVMPGADELAARLQSALIEIEDIAAEIDGLNQKVVYDAQKIEDLSERMALGYQLFKKHQVANTAELLEVKEQLEDKLEQISRLDDDIAAREGEAKSWLEKAMGVAVRMSGNRSGEIEAFEKKVNDGLYRVGMPNARIKVSVREVEPNPYGINEIEFLFNANKSARFEPVRKVASGGELSRLMLIIKSLVAQKVQLPTLIFDEIDTGISGEAARQVGFIIEGLSRGHQLITITHQPQIAARANTHFFIHKVQKDGEVVTAVRVLDKEERLTEIATMLAGSKPTAAAFESAREMMGVQKK